MPYHVITAEPEGEGRSSGLATIEDAMTFARDLTAAGARVVRIETPDGHFLAEDEIAAACGRTGLPDL